MQSLARLLLAFACLLLGPLAVIAKESPADTDKIKSLSPEQARKLVANLKGKGQRLDLNGLTKLDADTAKALAQYKGRDLYLYLNGLTTLSPEAATALAGFKDSLGLGPGVAELQTIALDNAGIVMLADRQQPQYLSFPHVTALDSPDAVAIAEILASVKAPVLLPNLKRLSAKTFETLTKKEDLLLAELDTLEFIPEPDGSGNASDDIVLPDGFEKRQRVLRKLFNVK